MAFTQDFRSQRRNYNDGETRIGETDRLWYDSVTNTIRISDGATPGGIVVGGGSGGGDYTLPTASSTVRGGVKIGSNITITDGVISVAAPFSGSYNDLTNKPTIPSLTGYATETFVTTRGYLTSVGTISYNDLSNKPTLFSGSYNDLTNKPTIPSLTGYATESYVTTRGYLTSYTETDPVFAASSAAGITSTDISNWGTAYGWGDHSTAGYLTTVDHIVKVADTFGITDPFKAEVVADLTYGVTIETWTGLPQFATSNSWEFGYDGNITFPDSTIQSTAWTGSVAYASVTGTPTLATVATSGSYADLSNKPTLFSGSYTDLTNKPTIPTTVTVNGTSITLGSSGTVTAAAGTLTGTTLNSSVVSSSLTSVGTLTGVTSNAITAFIAGTAAESGVALQMPREGALRNLYNGTTNMYFDVSTGGSTHGSFQFRSSNAFTNVLTMGPTAFNVNPDAVVTARTPSFGRLAWNSAIDTELTIDNYRFRVSNQGGNFPQIISNTGSTVNTAWTVVASRSGSAVTQTGSTGALIPHNSWTSLYTSGGMDSSGDTFVATLQDKGAGRIYRVTFMRSDSGTVGYNIIAERIL